MKGFGAYKSKKDDGSRVIEVIDKQRDQSSKWDFKDLLKS
ncbi:hypothetical protein DBT_2210 [Dissulfuribacter thermophilus]|uniref:Uncharacterized protein n=1 Tax=Dissulfuribacter thermophilus TaxID=1156395 RepID=A0A1B9F325_9BACT|nr:hypothetical protein DBT_2210 [Dissulfuribacter thermophilus]